MRAARTTGTTNTGRHCLQTSACVTSGLLKLLVSSYCDNSTLEKDRCRGKARSAARQAFESMHTLCFSINRRIRYERLTSQLEKQKHRSCPVDHAKTTCKQKGRHAQSLPGESFQETSLCQAHVNAHSACGETVALAVRVHPAKTVRK